ncbi:CYTH and CHAD domain-containing protein [Kerstersia gyiorum]|uniref:Adenylate cyclase n=1 Tax=Kerstersia gyiorum TaxID=206506 RepID=A0A171KNJ7_9BURK|nr:CYTH and CHAD domain-containing protein [Kerstersia gyiorum]AZV92827.1 inorganic triphosphatase [Bordetella sp. J329]MCO7641459.1 CYTH and CHAD domain-containing protein [Pseudomonas sp. S 311-6]KAB0544635.1 CYTH and CHAD domain-containing protein [Kerstersia gyiorum]KKO70464.1 adenylate cyclase [Kerstersia gyiorum]MCP1636339.1 inorganic triphosphatase YgiF [Kerstersia gyiorum]
MSEQELKLHVPASARAGVEKELARGATETIALHALYFDTPTRELAQARVAIRLRREGDHWVQTLKTPGAHALARLELNHDRPGPVLDLSVYADTPVAEVLAGLQGELGVRYETDVTRQLRRVRTRQGVVEIAYDQGWLRASGLELPISEVEFELVTGHLQAVFLLGRRWQQKHGLVLDLRSKSERGDALATTALKLDAAGPAGAPEACQARADEISRFWAPRPIKPVVLTARQSPAQALRAITLECLEQIARNAAVLTEIDTAGVYAAGQPGHVHQLRVGLRRLRSAWRLFDGWTSLPPEALQQTARTVFGQFGANRDDDVLRDEILPPLMAAGMPAITLPESHAELAASDSAGSRVVQGWLLDMLAWILDLPSAPAGTPPQPARESTDGDAPVSGQDVAIIPLDARNEADLRRLLMQRLRKWHRSVVRDGRNFSTLDIDTRHALRKRAKRLRYGLAFAESLLPQGRLRAYRRKLAAVQDQLGAINDIYVADARFAQLSVEQPHAWFARGWFAARLTTLEQSAQATLRDLGRGPGFWRD